LPNLKTLPNMGALEHRIMTDNQTSPSVEEQELLDEVLQGVVGGEMIDLVAKPLDNEEVLTQLCIKNR
jgi:hypothetical protein